MTSILSIIPSGTSAAAPLTSNTNLGTLATTADVPTLTKYIRQHPQDRDALENAMVKAGRTGDVSAISQALKKPDFDVAIWNRYGQTGGGPTYSPRSANDPAYKVSNSPAWGQLEAVKAVTPSERAVISRMSDSEGRLDAVQSYDNQIVSVGAMQKTVTPGGTGELPQQVWNFKQSNPDQYKSLFEDKGWFVERVKPGNSTESFALRLSIDGKTLTPRETAAFIKDRDSPDQWTTALDPLQKAGRDPTFQAQQLKDFNTRLHTAVDVKPSGANYVKPVGDYVTSEQGAALLLDQHVNRPGHVDDAFGLALDRFYAANPKADRDPANWTAEQRKSYEPAIVSNYVATRALAYGKAKTTMTDPVPRANHIIGASSPLSAAPGSFHRTETR